MDIWTKLAAYSCLETERVLLRPVVFSDSKAFYEFASQPANLDFIFPSQASMEESQFTLANYFMKEPLGIWAIADKKTDYMLGCIKLEKLQTVSRQAELGYFISKEVRGQGIMTEVVKNITYLCFEEFGLRQLSIVTHVENRPSQRVAEKAGYRLFRQFRGSDRYSKRMRDYLEFRMSRGDFYEQTSTNSDLS